MTTTPPIFGFNDHRANLVRHTIDLVVEQTSDALHLLNDAAYHETRRLDKSKRSKDIERLDVWRSLARRIGNMSESQRLDAVRELATTYAQDIAGNFEGVGILVATKGIDVTGNVTYSHPGSDAWAFLTPGYFKITGTTQVDGPIYCHNAAGEAEFIGLGEPNIFGGVLADVISVRGTYTVERDGTPANIADLPGALRRYGAPVVDSLYWERI